MNVQRFLTDPAAFRAHLIIDANGTAVQFCPDQWQAQDFAALDPAWRALVGQKANVRHRWAWMGRGRGHSKTSDIVMASAWPMIFSPRPLRGIAAAADRDQARLIVDGYRTLKRLNPYLFETLEIQQWAVTNTKTGSVFDILSSDVGSSFGQLCDFIVADELCHWPENKGEAFWTSLLSTAAKRASCILTIITNAGFVETWQYKLREAVRNDPAWYFHELDGPRASWITPLMLAQQERLLPGSAYERLWLNKWTSGTSDALSAADIDAAVKAGLQPMTGQEEGWRFFSGIDLAVSRDSAALVTLGKHFHGRLRLASVQAWKPPRRGEVDLNAVRQAVLETHRKFRSWMLYDPYQCALLAQDCRAEGCWMEAVPFLGAALAEMATGVIETFSTHNIDLYPDAALVGELKKLRLKESPSGWRLDAPRTGGSHCDRATAASLAILASRRAPSGVLLPDPEVMRAAMEGMKEEEHGHERLESRMWDRRSNGQRRGYFGRGAGAGGRVWFGRGGGHEEV